MPKCPHVDTCPLFPLFKLRGALRVWQENYCESDFERCERYQRALAGKVTPMNLLPNGKMLDVLAKGKP